MIEFSHGLHVIPLRWVSSTVLWRMDRSVPLANRPSPPATVKPSTMTWSAETWMLRTVVPSAKSLTGAFAEPGRFIVTSVSARSWPVKHTVAPGETAFRTAGTSSARVTVRRQSGGPLWSGAGAEFGLDGLWLDPGF
jgi:hypothetical protein